MAIWTQSESSRVDVIQRNVLVVTGLLLGNPAPLQVTPVGTPMLDVGMELHAIK